MFVSKVDVQACVSSAGGCVCVWRFGVIYANLLLEDLKALQICSEKETAW